MHFGSSLLLNFFLNISKESILVTTFVCMKQHILKVIKIFCDFKHVTIHPQRYLRDSAQVHYNFGSAHWFIVPLWWDIPHNDDISQREDETGDSYSDGIFNFAFIMWILWLYFFKEIWEKWNEVRPPNSTSELSGCKICAIEIFWYDATSSLTISSHKWDNYVKEKSTPFPWHHCSLQTSHF